MPEPCPELQAVADGEALVVVDLVVVGTELVVDGWELVVLSVVLVVVGDDVVEVDVLDGLLLVVEEPLVVVIWDEVVVVEVEVAFPSEGVAEHVDTRSPVANLARPSPLSGSLGPSGTVPTNIKLVDAALGSGSTYHRH